MAVALPLENEFKHAAMIMGSLLEPFRQAAANVVKTAVKLTKEFGAGLMADPVPVTQPRREARQPQQTRVVNAALVGSDYDDLNIEDYRRGGKTHYLSNGEVFWNVLARKQREAGNRPTKGTTTPWSDRLLNKRQRPASSGIALPFADPGRN